MLFRDKILYCEEVMRIANTLFECRGEFFEVTQMKRVYFSRSYKKFPFLYKNSRKFHLRHIFVQIWPKI